MSTKLPDLTEVSTPADDDLLYTVDVSDTTDAVDGSSKYVQVKNLRGGPQTAAESLAGVTPTNLEHPPGNVLRYGTNTTPGTTDMTGAVSNWLDVGMQGVTLVLPDEEVLVSTWTEKAITSDIKIVGGVGSKITGTTSDIFLRPAGGSIDIDGVEFDTWSQVIHNDNADSGTTPLLQLQNCVLRDCSANGINHERPINHFVLDNVRMYGMANYAVRIGRNTYAEQDDWKNFHISDVYIEDSTATGSTDCAGILLYGKNLQVSNLHIGTVTSDSGACWGLYTKVRYAQVSNVCVDNLVTTSGTDTVGLNIKGALKGVTSSPQGFTYVLNGLTVIDSDGVGIKIQQQDVLASNIHIEEFGVDGITIDDVGASNVVVNGFKVLTETAGTKVGVRITNNVGAIKVKNGVVDGANIGIRQAASSSGGVGFEISSIFAENCTTGFQINTNSPIDQIKMRDLYAGSGCTTGFITSGSGAVTNLEVIDCDFSDASTPTTIGGTLTTPKFRKVRGYVTDNAGAAASTADGGTISHGLASTPDVVTVNPSVASEMASVTAIGSTTFTVALKQDDGTAGTSQTVYWRASMDEAL